MREQRNLPQGAHEMTAAEARLAELIAGIGFGAVEQLRVRLGQPELDAGTVIVREQKFGADRPSGREGALAAPASQTLELIAALRRMPDTVVRRIDVRHGAAFRLIMTQAAPGARP